jgi:hypothetical protein
VVRRLSETTRSLRLQTLSHYVGIPTDATFAVLGRSTLEEQKGTKRYKRVQDFSGDLAARGKRRRRTRAWRSDVSTEKGDQVGFSTLTFGLPVIPPEQQMARRPSRQEFVFYAALV